MSLIFESNFYAFGFYVAVNALIMLVLGILVVRARVATRTDIGDGGIVEMAGPLRAHGNNTEYVPMALLLMWALASVPPSASIWVMHAAGATLTIGRICHAIGLSQSTGPSTMRLVGIMLTWISFIVGIVGVLYLVFLA
ncbi:MAG: MAPEG family protein [Rhizomicrobium sp.]